VALVKPRPELPLTTNRCGRQICTIGKSSWGSVKRFWCRLAGPALAALPCRSVIRLSGSSNRKRPQPRYSITAFLTAIQPE
jgi:hypothetical protein